MTPRTDERSLGELFAELSREMSVLVKKEVELASTEMTAKAKTALAGAGVAAAGGALAHAGFLVLLAAVVLGLAQLGVDAWVSAGIVAIVSMVVGYLLVNRGLATMRQTSVVPRQTIETLKESAAWTTRQGA